MRCRARCFLLAVVAAASVARSQVGIDVAWILPAGGVAFGQSFLVEVRRTWPRHCAPEPLDEQALAPLSLQLDWTASDGAADGASTELCRYRACAFASGELHIGPVVFRVRGAGGSILEASCTPPPLVVRSLLPEPPGDIEWPGDVQDLPRGAGLQWLFAALLAAVSGSVWWWCRPRRATIAPATISALALHEQALAQLAALPAPDARGTDLPTFYVQLAAIVREHSGRRFSLPAASRTSQELVLAVPVGAAALAECLQACDLVKFAALRPAADEHAAARVAAVAFVRATATEWESA